MFTLFIFKAIFESNKMQVFLLLLLFEIVLLVKDQNEFEFWNTTTNKYFVTKVLYLEKIYISYLEISIYFLIFPEYFA